MKIRVILRAKAARACPSAGLCRKAACVLANYSIMIEPYSSPPARIAAAAIAALGWAAIGTQVPLTLSDAAAAGNPAWLGLLNLFSYFTILSNVAVAVAATVAARGVSASWWARGSVRGALVLYIIVVGLIYQTLLKGLIPMAGTRLVIDTIFHAIIPLAWPMWWLAFGRGTSSLPWRAAFGWLVFPFVYGVYSVARGALSGRWPYPFMNAERFGYPQVALNLSAMLLLFLALAFLLIALDRRLSRRPAFS